MVNSCIHTFTCSTNIYGIPIYASHLSSNLQVLNVSRPLGRARNKMFQKNRGLYSNCKKMGVRRLRGEVTNFKTSKGFLEKRI